MDNEPTIKSKLLVQKADGQWQLLKAASPSLMVAPSNAASPLFSEDTDHAILPQFDPVELISLLAQSTVHYRCCQEITQDTVGAYDLNYTGETPTVLPGEEAPTPTAPQALADFLANCNPQISFVDIMRRAVFDMEATGNGYLELVRNPTNGQPLYLNHLPAQTIRLARDPDPDNNGRKFIYVQRYPYGNQVVFFKAVGDQRRIGSTSGQILADDDKTQLAATEVIHFKTYSPLDTLYGVPQWLPAVRSIIGNSQSEEYNLAVFMNSGLPLYYVSIESETGMALTDDVETNILDFLNTTGRGARNTGRTLLLTLPIGVKVSFNPVQSTVKDAAYREYYIRNRDNMLLGHGMLPNRIGIIESGNLGGGTGESQEKIYADSVIQPKQEYIEDVLNLAIVGAFDIKDWRIEFADVEVPDNVGARVEHAVAMVAAKLWKPNEARAYVGVYPSPIEGGDEISQASEPDDAPPSIDGVQTLVMPDGTKAVING